VGNVDEGLEECWRRIVPVRLDELGCDCTVKGSAGVVADTGQDCSQ